ncbi:MAG: hypothetical protein IT280_06340 [Ignavibacteria bacterium]|nr:hypothetical protein [Ignavibacteria bacterium]
MQWSIAKFYHINPNEAGELSELDFWQMREFESLEQAKMSYYLKLQQKEIL